MVGGEVTRQSSHGRCRAPQMIQRAGCCRRCRLVGEVGRRHLCGRLDVRGPRVITPGSAGTQGSHLPDPETPRTDLRAAARCRCRPAPCGRETFGTVTRKTSPYLV